MSETECRVPTAAGGLEPCPRCGAEQVWVASHSQCVRCRWITPCCEGAALPLREDLTADRRANVLRAWLARNAVAMPSEARLAEMVKQLWEARDDARVRVEHAGVAVVRHRGEATIERGLGPPAVATAQPQGWQVAWKQEPELDLGNERGALRFEPAKGEGIRAALVTGDWFVRPRRGGETIRLGADRPTRTLKNLLQERDVPMWQRENLPLLFHGERLVWVPGVGIAAEYVCGEGEPGFSPSWRVAGKAPLC